MHLYRVERHTHCAFLMSLLGTPEAFFFGKINSISILFYSIPLSFNEIQSSRKAINRVGYLLSKPAHQV